jgi:ribosomal protein L7/L12
LVESAGPDCKIKEGVDIEEALSVAKNLDRAGATTKIQ